MPTSGSAPPPPPHLRMWSLQVPLTKDSVFLGRWLEKSSHMITFVLWGNRHRQRLQISPQSRCQLFCKRSHFKGWRFNLLKNKNLRKNSFYFWLIQITAFSHRNPGAAEGSDFLFPVVIYPSPNALLSVGLHSTLFNKRHRHTLTAALCCAYVYSLLIYTVFPPPNKQGFE